MPNLLIGVTGSVATIKLDEIVERLQPHFTVRVVATQAALHFTEYSPILTDKDEWSQWNKRGDPVLHIELRKWADVLLLAPLDANTLAKIANGLCDNLLTCVVRAWDMRKPVWVAPAMNTHMYTHPMTERHLSVLRDFGFHIIPPISKELMCGDTGTGAMARPEDIAARIVDSL